MELYEGELGIYRGATGGSTTQYGICPAKLAKDGCWDYWEQHPDCVFSIMEEASDILEAAMMEPYDNSLLVDMSISDYASFDHYGVNAYPLAVLRDIIARGNGKKKPPITTIHGSASQMTAMKNFVADFTQALVGLLEQAGKDDVFIVFGP